MSAAIAVPERTYSQAYERIHACKEAVKHTCASWYKAKGTSQEVKTKLEPLLVVYESILEVDAVRHAPSTPVEHARYVAVVETYLDVTAKTFEECQKLEPHEQAAQARQACRAAVDEDKAVLAASFVAVEEWHRDLLTATQEAQEIGAAVRNDCRTMVEQTTAVCEELVKQAVRDCEQMVQMAKLENTHMVGHTALSCERVVQETHVACDNIVQSAQTETRQWIQNAVDSLRSGVRQVGDEQGVGPIGSAATTEKSGNGHATPAPANLAAARPAQSGTAGSTPTTAFSKETFCSRLPQPHRRVTESLLADEPIDPADFRPQELVIEWDREFGACATEAVRRGGRQAIWDRLAIKALRRDLLLRFDRQLERASGARPTFDGQGGEQPWP